MRSDPWSKALACYASASAAFAAAAQAVEPAAWDRPRAEGKWSPAQLFCGRHIEHHLAQLETLNRA